MEFHLITVKGWEDTPPDATLELEIERFLREQDLSSSQVIVLRKSVPSPRNTQANPRMNRVKLIAVILYGDIALEGILLKDSPDDAHKLAVALVECFRDGQSPLDYAKEVLSDLGRMPSGNNYEAPVDWG